MFPLTSHRTLALALAFSASLGQAFAGAPTRCDKLAQDVHASAEKEPSKVLMIVEDALVMNESCACEIIKAAITGSKADTALAKQIVQTAVAVAPKMSPVIIDCANNVAPGSAETSDVAQVASATQSGKSGGKSPSESIMPPKDGKGDFSGGSNAGIRGVYLMAPAVGGFVGASTGPNDDGDDDDDNDNDNSFTKKRRKHCPTPISKSVSTPKDPKDVFKP
jgi:hypothetical protein